MQRVVVLGRGAGKTTAAARLGVISGLPVIELDGYFWNPDLTPMPMQFCIDTQSGWLRAPGGSWTAIWDHTIRLLHVWRPRIRY